MNEVQYMRQQEIANTILCPCCGRDIDLPEEWDDITCVKAGISYCSPQCATRGSITWEQFTKRTDDPKLTYIEHRLGQMNIPHRRRGESWHAPILEVAADKIDEAWALLNEQVDMGDGTTMHLDDINDDDPIFQD